MTVVSAGRAPATFEIKSAHLPLVSLLLKSADLAAFATELKARYGDIPDFFDHDALVIDLTPLRTVEDAAVDFTGLSALLRGYKLMPVAVRGGSETQMRAALDAGLSPAPDAKVATAARSEPEPAPPPQHALVIDKPLRSGQQVYARGRDLVMLSMVNAGAEVIADGHIHVYAPLRGKAIAGARGNTSARILALSLEAELISIAGVYRTSEVPLPPEVHAKPTQVRLAGGGDGKLVMEALAGIAPSPSGRGRG